MSILCSNVTKKYGDTTALDNINIKFEIGMNILIGSNGAGKSTMLNILSTILFPTKGDVKFNDHTIYSKNYKSKLGYLPQDFSVYENITGYEFLFYMSCIKGLNRAKSKKEIVEYLNIFNLSQSAGNRLSSYSGGMKQRIGIIQALLGKPEIIILDEPFNSLDPGERRMAKNILKDLSKNSIIILSSHVLQELEEFEGKLTIIDKGKIVTNINMDEIKTSKDANFLESFYFESVKDYNKIKGNLL